MDFQQAEKKFKQLKAQFEAGTLNESDFKNQLEGLMIQDEGGSWWMIGYETEQWYRNDGDDWVLANPPANSSSKTSSSTNWIAIFWITLGFAVGWTLGIALLGDFLIVLAIAWVTGWAIGGLVTAVTLRSEHVLKSRKSILWITLGWAIAFLIGLATTMKLPMDLPAFGAMMGLIGGGIGGFITGSILRKDNAIPNRKSIYWITLAWSIGGAIGGAVGLAIGPALGGSIGDLVGLPVGLGIGGAIHGGIGGFVTIWQIKKREENRGFRAAQSSVRSRGID